MEVKTAKQTNKATWQHHIDKTDQFGPLLEACWKAINVARDEGIFNATIGPNEFDFPNDFKNADPHGARGCAVIMMVKRYFRSRHLEFKVLKLSTNKFPIQIEW